MQTSGTSAPGLISKDRTPTPAQDLSFIETKTNENVIKSAGTATATRKDNFDHVDPVRVHVTDSNVHIQNRFDVLLSPSKDLSSTL